MKFFWSRAVLAVSVFILWLTLTSPPQGDELLMGGLVALILALLPLPGTGIWGEIILFPKRILYALMYVPVFLWAVVKSNFDVALRVLAPTLPINPGLVRVKTKLKSRMGRLILASSITLTPGTITVDMEGDELVIHWINRTSTDMEKVTKEIVGGFEGWLEVIFG